MQKVRSKLAIVLQSEQPWLVLLLASSVVVNLLLALHIKENRDLIGILQSNRKLTLNELAPPLTALDSEGEWVTVEFTHASKPTVLYIQSASCGWCDRNRENLEELANQSENRYRLINLHLEERSTSSRPPHIPSLAINLFNPTVESKIRFDLYSTPSTMLFAEDGTLKMVWKGAYNSERKVEIEREIGIKLPGI